MALIGAVLAGLAITGLVYVALELWHERSERRAVAADAAEAGRTAAMGLPTDPSPPTGWHARAIAENRRLAARDAAQASHPAQG